MNIVGALMIVVCGFLFVTVSSRLTGEIGSSSNPISGMKMLVVIAAASMSMVAVAPVQAQEALAKSAGCMNCHAVDTKKVGPAFKDVAAKYKGKADAEATIVTELTTAKGHPAVKASPDDVKSLVKWVLSL